MTFAKSLRGLGLVALVVALAVSSVEAQNGTNYNSLTNGFEGIYFGIGAGSISAISAVATGADGMGTWTAGENIQGSTTVAFSGTFGYRQNRWREAQCSLLPTAGPGLSFINFPLIAFIENDGGDAHLPNVQTLMVNGAPSCSSAWPSVFAPYGTPGGATASFVLIGLPTGVAPTAALLYPNEGVTSGTGTAFLIAIASANTIGPVGTGCYGIQFQWLPSALASFDRIDGWWHYTQNAHPPGLAGGPQGLVPGVQYWGMSFDELNIWRSQTASTVTVLAPQDTLIVFAAEVDYQHIWANATPETRLTGGPFGHTAGGAYYAQTENVNTIGVSGGDSTDPGLNPYGGFDAGGHNTVTIGGKGGVLSPTTGSSPQDPAIIGGLFGNQFGMVTFDNASDGDGSKRLTWLSVDTDSITDQLLGGGFPPEGTTDVLVSSGTVRVPASIHAADPATIPPSPDTQVLFAFFGHDVKAVADPAGYPDPGGFAAGAFGVTSIGAASNQFPLGGGLPKTVCLFEFLGPGTNAATVIEMGSSGRKGTPAGTAGGLTWNQSVAGTSGRVQFMVVD